ncbi:MAG: ABC transporter permease subunit, partial [Anaerolineae bacterium]|nr:ABC transporter permease subunit [Anaerolineae bacterium]
VMYGGVKLTLPFLAVFLGLTLYTAAFIADIVRAGIQSVPYGQIEASRSLGLRGSQVVSMIVLPQALRLIVPPLGNQWVNLGKNSSLGFAVGFAEVYTTTQLANNESDQAVPFFASMMIIYLSLSLFLSLIANTINSFTKVRTR